MVSGPYISLGRRAVARGGTSEVRSRDIPQRSTATHRNTAISMRRGVVLLAVASTKHTVMSEQRRLHKLSSYKQTYKVPSYWLPIKRYNLSTALPLTGFIVIIVRACGSIMSDAY